ncbi:hypothetical protein INT43_004209 [Umbelopsis isabellina]|uniref:Diphthine--ammonia ligase n=1 Tax=Mortierella isabellina TaxID=91625 RepID=A0A8H7UBU7_MORIS|nr:hypothetical protein INT43_004209 [Umbelopsis isabellina]
MDSVKQSKHDIDELDSFMYQTVGHDAIHFYAECMDLPLYRREILGSSVLLTPDYVVTRDDETEDLLCLLQDVMDNHPDVEAVSVGAILSNYQRIRVEHVCNRLGLVSMAYLWRRDQKELLSEMASAGVGAILIKVAAMGLSARHLGKSIAEMYPFLCTMNEQYDLHICGEGGEYETFTLDCPLFKKRIVIDEIETVTHDDAAFAPVAYLKFKQCHLEQKSEEEMQSVRDVVTIPRWEESWDRYQDIVVSMQPADSVNGPTFKLPLVDSVKSRQTQYNISNRGDYYAIAGTTAYSNNDLNSTTTAISDIQEETRQCMQNIQKQLKKVDLTWDDVVLMQVYVANMSDFAQINLVYKTFFGINPPPRALVGTALEQPARLQIDIIARRFSLQNSKQTMHVQGMSYWAPANIGPYSQSAVTKELAFIAGQIGMIPHTLDLPQPRSLVSEAALSLRNLENITNVLNQDLAQEAALCYCYVSDRNLLPNAHRAWTAYLQNTSAPPSMFVAVTSLPKNALIEWQVILGVKNSMPDSDDSDDSDEDDKPAKAIDAKPPGSTITERSDILVETQIWSSDTMYFAASYATINDDTLPLDSLIDIILADIGKSISVFGNGWHSILAIRVFYCLQQDESSSSKLEEAFKQRFSNMSPSSQPALTMVPATAIGPDAQASLAVCIQAVK